MIIIMFNWIHTEDFKLVKWVQLNHVCMVLSSTMPRTFGNTIASVCEWVIEDIKSHVRHRWLIITGIKSPWPLRCLLRVRAMKLKTYSFLMHIEALYRTLQTLQPQDPVSQHRPLWGCTHVCQYMCGSVDEAVHKGKRAWLRIVFPFLRVHLFASLFFDWPPKSCSWIEGSSHHCSANFTKLWKIHRIMVII